MRKNDRSGPGMVAVSTGGADVPVPAEAQSLRPKKAAIEMANMANVLRRGRLIIGYLLKNFRASRQPIAGSETPAPMQGAFAVTELQRNQGLQILHSHNLSHACIYCLPVLAFFSDLGASNQEDNTGSN
jgi:hypothetical protein